jgi:hypothetical protein
MKFAAKTTELVSRLMLLKKTAPPSKCAMSIATPVSDPRKVIDAEESRRLAITDGEIHFLWWFIQGSIMTPETRKALLRAYGFCERHAWVHLSVEMSFRTRHFLGPVILYQALIEKSVRAVQARQRIRFPSTLRQLQAAGPCFLCALNINHAAAGAAPPSRLDRGRDSSALRAFATSLAALWRPTVCTICAGEACEAVVSSRCRPHLLAALQLQLHKPVDVSWQQATLEELALRLARYQASFVAGADEPSDQACAALIAATGWCSGWRPLLTLLGSSG